MNDLERRVKAILDADAAKAPRVSAPPDLRRRVHRRQAKSGALVAFTAATAVIVVIGGLRVVAPLGDVKQPAGVGSPRTRTSTVNGVTISYPDDWAVATLSSDVSLGEGSVADGEVIVGHDVLFLSNTEPAAGASGFFPLGCNAPPDGSVALLLRDFGDAPAALGLEHRPWPATPSDGYPQRPGDETGSCPPATPIRSASWLASGRLFEAILVGQPGPSLDRLLEAYRTMTFSDAPSWRLPAAPDGSIISSPRWVIESGEAPGQDWNLLAYATRYPLAPSRVCLGLDINGVAVDQMCDLDLAWEEQTSFESRVIRVRIGRVSTTYVYGGISPPDAVITAEMAEGSAATIEPARVTTMPASLDVPFVAGISVSPGRPEGVIRVTDPRSGSLGVSPVFGADGNVLLPVAGAQGTESVQHLALDERWAPPVSHEGGSTVMPVTFPDGSTAELVYPSELGLEELSVAPYTHGTLKQGSDPCGWPVDATRHDPHESWVSGDAPLATHLRNDGGIVELWQGRRSHEPYNYLIYRFGSWNVLVGCRSQEVISGPLVAWANNLGGHETSDGLLVVTGLPPLAVPAVPHEGTTIQFSGKDLFFELRISQADCRGPADPGVGDGVVQLCVEPAGNVFLYAVALRPAAETFLEGLVADLEIRNFRSGYF